jgi:two-component system nitrogen regulation response regulator GlnG
MKILVVDDEQLVRWFLERALKKWGHSVVSVSNPGDALSQITSRNFDVLFTDLRMPEANGTSLVKMVRDMPDKNPTIVVCSAFITAEMAQDFKKKGILMLKKPFKLAELEYTLDCCAAT